MVAEGRRAGSRMERKHWELALLLTAVLSVSMSSGVILPILPFLVERMAGSEAVTIAMHTGALTGVYTFVLFICSPLWGRLSDHVDRRHLIAAGLAGTSITLMMLDVVVSLRAFYLVRVLSGVLAATVLPAVLAYAAETSEASKRPQRFSLIASATTLGFLLGPVIGNQLSSMALSPFVEMRIAGVIMPDSPFFTIALLGLLSASTALFLPRSLDRRPLAATGNGAAQVPVNQHQVFMGLILTCISAFCITIAEVGITLLGKQVLSMTSQEIARFFLGCAIVMMVVQVAIFPACSQRIPMGGLLAGALTMVAIGIGLIPFGDSLTRIMLAFASVSAGIAIAIPALATLISGAAGARQGQAMGQQAAAANLGQAVAATLTGFLFSVTAAAPFLAATALAAGGIAMAVCLQRSG